MQIKKNKKETKRRGSIVDPAKARVTHVLKDGTVVDSIEGHVVRYEDVPEIYDLINRINRDLIEKFYRGKNQSK